jgi:hypothetical protein
VNNKRLGLELAMKALLDKSEKAAPGTAQLITVYHRKGCARLCGGRCDCSPLVMAETFGAQVAKQAPGSH